MLPIGWGWALLVWFLVNDRVKLAACCDALPPGFYRHRAAAPAGDEVIG